MSSIFLDRNTLIETTSRNLPHWHQDGKLQFVTFHLADSLPQSILTELQQEKGLWLKTHPTPWTEEETKEYHYRYSRFVDRWLDAAHGSCILSQPGIADIVEDTLNHFNGVRYLLHAYVVMPNHVHVLVETEESERLTAILHSWKSFTAHAINKLSGTAGGVWTRESFDRILRDEAHYRNAREYIVRNIKQGA